MTPSKDIMAAEERNLVLQRIAKARCPYCLSLW